MATAGDFFGGTADTAPGGQAANEQQQNGGMASALTSAVASGLLQSATGSAEGGGGMPGLLGEAAKNEFHKRTGGYMDKYANVDVLQPYFDVEPADIRNRLMQSLRPRMTQSQVIPGDLYGPIMIVYTLAGILLVGMKSSNVSANNEGTLMGKAFGVSFGYWFGFSTFLYGLCFIFNTAIKATEILSTSGYGMFGFCIVLLADYIQPGQFDFYAAWMSVGLLACLKVGTVLRSRTADPKQGLLVGGAAFAISWIYAYHLHWSYAPPQQ